MFARLMGLIGRLLGRGGAREPEVSVSLVILSRQAPSPSHDELVAAIKRALPINAPEVLAGGTMPPPEYAPDAEACRTLPIAVNRAVYGVLVAPFPYSDPAQPLAPNEDERFMRAYQQHRGWLAVDFVAGQADDAYSIIGQIAAELMDEHACLLFVPALGVASLPSPELLEDMRRGVWLQHFHVAALGQTYERRPDDPALEQAKRTAHERWNEFTQAFAAGDGDNFSVKFPFAQSEHVEHMWVEVTAIEGDTIRGTLGNQPEVVTNFTEGQDVERSRDEMEDWLFMRNGAIVGGFSLHALLQEDEP